MTADKPLEVAIVGSGCAAVSAAFELTRPELDGRYSVTIYQQGWRMGGKGASGRGANGRIEEHGLHVWLGFYENAFKLLRECYEELNRDPDTCPIACWQDAFCPSEFVGITDSQGDEWHKWLAYFPPAPGLPGDPIGQHNPFTVQAYMGRTAELLRALLFGVMAVGDSAAVRTPEDKQGSVGLARDSVTTGFGRVTRYGSSLVLAGLVKAVRLLEITLQSLTPVTGRLGSTRVSDAEQRLIGLVEDLTLKVRGALEGFITADADIRLKWEIIDLVLAIMLGIVRDRLLFDPRGFDAINDYECREWLRRNGASERAVQSPFVRGLYDLALAYEEGDPDRPGLAAGQAIRGSIRMFFSYRGAFFWKMRAGMGDVIFAPFFEVLKRRGVKLRFFHRLENVRIASASELAEGEKSYVKELEFSIQAQTRNGAEYDPLVDVRGLPCWPARPDFDQLVDGARLSAEQWEFESHWERRRSGSRTLRVRDDFDFVVLGVSIGAIPYVCREIIALDPRWQAMVDNVKTVATQAFQVWLDEDLDALGWDQPPPTVAGFVKPFDTWSDMRQVVPFEDWTNSPCSVAYFCNVLPDPPSAPDDGDAGYPGRRRAEVRRNAVEFLENHVRHLWPGSVGDKRRIPLGNSAR